jgi:hypothetical protein
MAFCVEDFRALDEALNALSIQSEAQFITMMMYYKPWIIEAKRAEGWAFGNSTYYQRLHAAHAYVASNLYDIKNNCVPSKPIAQACHVE